MPYQRNHLASAVLLSCLVVLSSNAQTADPFESLAREFVQLVANPTEAHLTSLLPTNEEIGWIVANNVPLEYRDQYPEWYSNVGLMRSKILSGNDFSNLSLMLNRWHTETPVVAMSRVVYGGHDVSPASEFDQSNGTSHLMNVKLSFPFEGFGELQYLATLQVARTENRAALIRYYLFDSAVYRTPWHQPTAAWDTYVNAVMSAIKTRDRDVLLQKLAPSEEDRRWFADNRTSDSYRADVVEFFFDEYWQENMENSVDELFDTVYEYIPDADRMELVSYAPLTSEDGEEGAMVSVKSPSVPSAVFSFSALQGRDKFYYGPHGTGVTTDLDEIDEEAWALSFTLYSGAEVSLAAADASARARAAMKADCPGFDEAFRAARRPVQGRAQMVRKVLRGGADVLACEHVEDLVGNAMDRLLARRGEAQLWMAMDEESDLGEDSTAVFLQHGIESYARALAIVEAPERSERSSTRRLSREYREQIVAAAETAFAEGASLQRLELQDWALEYFTAAAMGSFYLDPNDPNHKQIRSYSGYVVGGTALNERRVEEARRFLPLVVPPDPALLEASDADLAEALFLDAGESANMYFNLGAMTFNEAWARYEARSAAPNPDYTDLPALLEEARIALALAKRLDPDLANVDAAASEVESLTRKIAGEDG